ncbi:MAG: arylsulfatase [Lentisphaeraceae bacterium]|nr:arylsulfatase [Lentisphaeraceae bacterium]
MKSVFVFFLLTIIALAADRPNVIVILTDDQGWGDLSLTGNKDIETPHIDSIGKDGAVFENFYVAPVCSPTRAEFLTGRYSFRSGIWSTSEGGERIDLDEVTIADTFKKAGYNTAAFGKWHSGMQYPYHPNGRGFDEYYGFCSGHWGNYFDPILEHNGKIVKGKGFLVDDLTDRAMNYIEANQEKPFFVYLPYNTPHSPMQVPDRWWDKFKNKELKMKYKASKNKGTDFVRAALAMCENIDWNVGRLLKKLDELKIADNTIILYFSDNGPNSSRWNGGMTGTKGSTDEGGVRSPLVMKWPAKIKKGTIVREITSGVDLLPSLAKMSSVPLMSKLDLDGVDFSGVATGEDKSGWPVDRVILNGWKGRYSLRSQKFRLDYKGNLFDIENDRGQQKVVNDKFPNETKKMLSILGDFKKQVSKELPKKDLRPFVICHPDFVNTQVPARDGKAHGNVKRSNRWPNCSFFTNWTSLNDKITFDAEVAESGEFEVEIYYTCPEDSVGSTFEVSCGKNRLEAKITEAHDPPLVGMKEDRVVRGESYVKDFKRKVIGTIKLDKGPATLTLKALNIPGKQVMDFRLMMLRRL